MAQPTSDERFDFNRPLWNPVGNRTIAYAEQVQDDKQGKKQSEINQQALDWAVVGWVL